MIATTFEQSKRLLACGTKAETADMINLSYRNPYTHDVITELVACAYAKFKPSDSDKVVPAWPLSALLTEVLPKSINNQLESELELGVFEDRWYCKYCYSSTEVWASDPIEACIRMVELLHEKNLLK